MIDFPGDTDRGMDAAAPAESSPQERAALMALPVWSDEDLAAVLGLSRDRLRRALAGAPEGTPPRRGAVDLRLARCVYLGTSRRWVAADVVRLLSTSGAPMCAPAAPPRRSGMVAMHDIQPLVRHA